MRRGFFWEVCVGFAIFFDKDVCLVLFCLFFRLRVNIRTGRVVCSGCVFGY